VRKRGYVLHVVWWGFLGLEVFYSGGPRKRASQNFSPLQWRIPDWVFFKLFIWSSHQCCPNTNLAEMAFNPIPTRSTRSKPDFASACVSRLCWELSCLLKKSQKTFKLINQRFAVFLFTNPILGSTSLYKIAHPIMAVINQPKYFFKVFHLDGIVAVIPVYASARTALIFCSQSYICFAFIYCTSGFPNSMLMSNKFKSPILDCRL
jgi:hypothetical protein